MIELSFGKGKYSAFVGAEALGESGDFGDGESALLRRGEVGADMASYCSAINSASGLFEITLSYFLKTCAK